MVVMTTDNIFFDAVKNNFIILAKNGYWLLSEYCITLKNIQSRIKYRNYGFCIFANIWHI